MIWIFLSSFFVNESHDQIQLDKNHYGFVFDHGNLPQMMIDLILIKKQNHAAI